MADPRRHQLAALAALLLPSSADDAAIAGLLSELLVILRLHDGLRRGVVPPRSSVRARSQAIADLEAAVARALRHYRDLADSVISPSALPAGLEDGTAHARSYPQAPQSCAQDVIDLGQAGILLGVGRERARQLVREHKLTSWSKLTGRHELQMYRAEVIALCEHRSGDGGIGSRERRPDPGRATGGGPAGRNRAA